MLSRRGNYANFQARAEAFKVRDRVFPVLGGNPSNGGVVVAVWPAIGMVDVQYPYGVSRTPVEDLLIDRGTTLDPEPDIQADSIPGGTHTVSVPGGPGPEKFDSTHRVALQYVKQAVYWAAKGRLYKPTKTEIETGQLCCPRCEDAYLRKTIYMMEGGTRVKMFVCPGCLFLVRRDDIIGFEE
jgi:hypothetical protein